MSNASFASLKPNSSAFLKSKQAPSLSFNSSLETPLLSNTIAEYPILVTKTSDQALHLFNGYMNKLAQQCGIEERITSYEARHSWASAARKMGVSTDKIGDALGHESYDTTEVYLQDFDSQVLDDMNADVTSK